ncbi:hypothetical protein D3C87_77140 [compost metagenome]
MKAKTKFYITIFLLAVVFYLHVIWSPVVSTQAALNQVNDNWTSSTTMQSITKFQQYLWILYIVIPVISFRKEIVKFFKNKRGEN